MDSLLNMVADQTIITVVAIHSLLYLIAFIYFLFCLVNTIRRKSKATFAYAGLILFLIAVMNYTAREPDNYMSPDEMFYIYRGMGSLAVVGLVGAGVYIRRSFDHRSRLESQKR